MFEDVSTGLLHLAHFLGDVPYGLAYFPPPQKRCHVAPVARAVSIDLATQATIATIATIAIIDAEAVPCGVLPTTPPHARVTGRRELC